jgi:nitrogen fixation protein FixH
MTRRFTGWHMAAILIAFFAVVITVNMLMAVLATRTFGGTVVDNSYVASQEFNRWLAEARRQEASGWEAKLVVDDQRRVIVAPLQQGRAVEVAVISGFAEHPLGRAADVPLRFVETAPGHYRSLGALPAGRWIIRITVRSSMGEARLVEEVA